MKEFLTRFLEEYAEKFGYTSSIEGEGEVTGLISTQYGQVGFEQTEADEIRFLKIAPLDDNNDDQISSLIKINKHFKSALKTAAEENANEEEEEETVPVGKKAPTKPPAKPPAPAPEPEPEAEAATDEETDSLGRKCPPPSNKPPAHFTKPEKAKGGKKTANDKIVPPAEVEPPLPAEAIPGTHAYGIAQRAKEAAAKAGVAVPGEKVIPPTKNALGNSDAAMAKAASATIGGKKAPAKADPPDEPMEPEAVSLDDIMDGKVAAPGKPVASQPAAGKPALAVQPRAPVVQPAKQEMAATQPLSGGFRKAERKKAKLRLGITGPAGSGKTMSALLIAGGLVDGDYSKIGIADTENGSGDLYVHSDISGFVIGEYNVLTLNPPFEASKFIDAIKTAEASGLEVLILDSISHAWAGVGGFLEKQGKIADKTGNSWAAWRTISPEHAKFVDTMLQSKIHIIATMRSKTEHVFDAGKVRKVGLAAVSREGMEYEFSLVLDMDQQHNATPTKDRTSMFDGSIFKPTPETGKQLRKWLEIEG